MKSIAPDIGGGQGGAGTGPLAVGFLGGAINSAAGRAHRTAIEMDQRFQLQAACFSRQPDINQATAQAYRVEPARTYRSLDEMLEQERQSLDAVVILTPTDQHRDQVLACVSAGMPVICEKALVASSADGQTIKERSQDKGGFVAVTYNYTGYPMLRELRQLVRRGYLGKIEQVHVEMPQEGFARTDVSGNPVVPQDWRLRDARVPTISLDLGVHTHIIVDFLTNEKPVELVAMSDTYGNFHQIVDNVICLARYTNDVTCSNWYTKTAFGHRNGLKVRLFGSERAAEWVQEAPEYLHMADKYGHKYMLDRASPEATISNQARYTRFKAGHPAGFIEAFANYYHDIADALTAHLNGSKPHGNEYVHGIDEVLEGVRMLEAIAVSAKERRWVHVT
ncbi:MAG: hypothetical protein QOI12_645 [Alphaproteobacteria bacterium]|nr:hypothetical protein [Alphaproteobacteria bacterium]